MEPDVPNETAPVGRSKAVTLRTLRRMARKGEPFACLTAYDATTARLLERAGVHMLLVGDSAAEVVLGLPGTIHMPLEVAIALTAAVKRGAPRTVVMADMPFMSYQASEAEGMRNAGRFMTEGLADIVKLEVDASSAALVSKLTSAGVPVCAHVGSRPQTAAMTGGYASAGRTADEAERILRDAEALERAGSVMLLIEAVPDEVAQEVVRRAGIPVIGIGAGTSCHGQILVLHDLVGMTDHPPRFAEAVASIGDEIVRAGASWVRRVGDRAIGGERYSMASGEAEALAAREGGGASENGPGKPDGRPEVRVSSSGERAGLRP